MAGRRTGTRHRILSTVVTGALLLTVLPGLAGCGVPADSLPPLASGPASYRLGTGDQVRITTFGEPGMTGEFRVDDSGKVALPLAGGAQAAGLTPAELSAEVTRLLQTSGLYRDPKISVEVTQYRPIFVLGEVAKPGQYPYQPGMNVLTAVAVAGGFTYRAVTDRFSVVRAGAETAPVTTAVEGRALRDTVLLPSDVLTVHERIF